MTPEEPGPLRRLSFPMLNHAHYNAQELGLELTAMERLSLAYRPASGQAV
jgi:hypothetical protein